jgi:hypothetical protein
MQSHCCRLYHRDERLGHRVHVTSSTDGSSSTAANSSADAITAIGLRRGASIRFFVGIARVRRCDGGRRYRVAHWRARHTRAGAWWYAPRTASTNNGPRVQRLRHAGILQRRLRTAPWCRHCNSSSGLDIPRRVGLLRRGVRRTLAVAGSRRVATGRGEVSPLVDDGRDAAPPHTPLRCQATTVAHHGTSARVSIATKITCVRSIPPRRATRHRRSPVGGRRADIARTPSSLCLQPLCLVLHELLPHIQLTQLQLQLRDFKLLRAVCVSHGAMCSRRKQLHSVVTADGSSTRVRVCVPSLSNRGRWSCSRRAARG